MLTGQKTYHISVIIPVLNEADQVERTLAKLVGQPGVEVIVVDGGSTDATRQKAEICGARVVSSPAGRGRQMNIGAGEAQGEILLFLHADTALPPGFQKDIRRAAGRRGFVGGAFRFALEGEGVMFRSIEFFTNLRARVFGLPYGDQAFFIRARTFHDLGGYAEMPILEDLDLVRRVGRLGRIDIVCSAVRTSARRWRRLGIVRTIVVNQLILLGFLCGVAPFRLARWYRQGQQR